MFGQFSQQSSAPYSVPAPVGGLNARDSLVAMPPTDAVVLQNWWPQPYGVAVRKGYREWATGLVTQAATIATWADTNGTQKLFAWAGTNVFDITTPGPVGAPLISGLNNPNWDTVHMVNTSGAHLIALNGVDDGIIYGAGGGARIIAGDGIVANTWAGIDPKNAVGPVVHQHRLWVVQTDTTFGWFLPPDALQGTFLKYDFGPLFSKGGFLQFLATWTIDDGNGAEDHLIAVSSRGEAVVYSGTDPEDDQAWFLAGVYNIGAPVAGRRANCKAGGDQFILTQQGLVSMSATLVSTRVAEQNRKISSEKVQFLLSELTSTYGSLFGWDVKYYPKDNLLIINVPTVVVSGNIQLAANQITGAWTEFRGMDAVCWGVYGSTPMFSDSEGTVYQAWVGTTDKVKLDGTGGIGIITSVQQAYSYLGSPATQKQVGLYRPVFVLTAPFSIKSTIRYDFSTEPLTVPNAAPKTFAALWGSGVWGTSIWGGGDLVQRVWLIAEGMGNAASLLMVGQSEGEVLWVSTDFSTVKGNGIL
jgi:hypothetical protein